MTKAAGGFVSHAEGINTTASNAAAHAEGQDTTASGENSHSEGRGTRASGVYSHASGYYTTAGHRAQTVVGEYNDNKEDTFFEVGNGSAAQKSNAFEVKKNGSIVVGGVTLTPEQLTKLLALIN